MTSLKHFLLFTKTNLMHLKRKWLTLPLLFVFPFIMVGLIIFLITTFFYSEDERPIYVGLVNYDESDHAKMVIPLIIESSQLNEYIHMELMTEKKAKERLETNEISTYVVFPEQFISDLLQGNSITLPVRGNPDRPLESILVHEIIESITRHIRSSQANILTINAYAKELGMSKEQRDELMIEQFNNFLFYTLGSNQIVKERKVDHSSSTNPVHYFGTSFFFIMLTLWSVLFYQFFYSESHKQIKLRIRLYGVTALQQILAKIVLSLLSTVVFSGILLILLHVILEFELHFIEGAKLMLISVVYSGTFLIVLGILEVLISAHTIRLLTHCFVTFLAIFCSGAIIPTIYFPTWIQERLHFLFTYEAFYWMAEITVHNRIYTSFLTLFFMMIILFIIFIGLSIWKERVK